jgi:hypothetical protein
MKFIGTTILTVVFLATGSSLSHAQSPTLTQVYGPASVPPGCRAYGCPWPPFFYLPPFLQPLAYAPAPPVVIEPPVVEALPPPVAAPPVNAAPPPMGWVYLPFTAPGPGAIFVNVPADGLNVRTVPNGPVIASLANGVPVIPLQRDGNWVLVAPGCALAPTYTWSITAGVPLSVCI